MLVKIAESEVVSSKLTFGSLLDLVILSIVTSYRITASLTSGNPSEELRCIMLDSV